jgi:cell division protein FtsI (penicillin-binding protein 3)
MKSTGRLGFVHATMAFFALAILGKAAQVQVVDHGRYVNAAAKVQLANRAMPAPRGDILDATGQVLAQNRAMVRLAFKPAELLHRDKVIAELRAAGVDARVLARAADTNTPWVVIPGTFAEVDVATALSDRVTATRIASRTYSLRGSTMGIVGRVDGNNKAVDGIELAMDAVLKGKDGSEAFVRDGSRRLLRSPLVDGVEPVKGQTVQLTINLALQAIVENALDTAVAKLGADGGDIVILNPHTGELLAAASHRAGSSAATPSAFTEPFEPGSTMKPFIAAALIESGLASETDSVDTGAHGAKYEINGRQIDDEHGIGRASLSDVIRESSNIGIVKFAERMSPSAEYQALRDFGFGTPTGITFPSEAGGRLMEPARWSRQSPQSLAMGYEVAVTALQLAAAYATFANGGELIEPWLVKEIRSPDGEVDVHDGGEDRHSPRNGQRALRHGTLQPQLRGALPRRRTAIRDRREADHGQDGILCRPDRRTAHAGGARGCDCGQGRGAGSGPSGIQCPGRGRIGSRPTGGGSTGHDGGGRGRRARGATRPRATGAAGGGGRSAEAGRRAARPPLCPRRAIQGSAARSERRGTHVASRGALVA